MLLSDVKIRNAKVKTKSYKISDGEGLFLLVNANGSKYWQFRYRFAGRARSLSIGKYPLVKLTEARDRKLDALRKIRDNIDPSSHKKQEKILSTYNYDNTFRVVAKEWHERNKGTWTEKHVVKTWGRLEKHVLPYLGSRPIAEIQPLELLEVIRKIERRGKTDMSRRVLQICSSIFRYAIITGRTQNNVSYGLSDALKPHRVEHYPIIKQDEISGFLRALDSLEAMKKNKLAFELLLLTALRTGEMRHSKWEYINLEKREWKLPAEIMKMRSEHVVPLSRQAINVLIELHSITGHSEWILPSSWGRENKVISDATITRMIERMGYKGRIVGHGFRALFSTAVNEKGFNRDAIERQLAHMERNGSRAAYNRAEYMQERHEMMQWWANWLDQCRADASKSKQASISDAFQPTALAPSFTGLGYIPS